MSRRIGSARRSRGGALLLAVSALACDGESWVPAPTPGPAPGVEPRTDPGTKGVHRLNRAEYNATVADVLGTELEPATASWREGELEGFDNIAAVLGVDEQQYERYFAAAKELSADVMGEDSRRGRFVTCDLNEPSCVESSVSAAGLRLFRRPLTSGERALYVKVHRDALALGDAPAAAFELVLRALLSSAPFLYRIELDRAEAAGRAHALDPFELASRLSYFLWSSAPDDALLEAAAAGTLTQDATLVATVDRMLAAPKGARFVERFAGQWLGARMVVAHASASSSWTPELAHAAGEEMTLYFREFVETDRSWFDFLKADVNYVTEPLAQLYGLETPSMHRARVEAGSDERAGFLGLAGFLAVSSYDRRTSPSLRGRWISSNLLCAEPPPPPTPVPTLAVPDTGAVAGNIRQALEQHRQNPACSSCHAVFDPYGLALEAFDAIGQYRATYPDGSPIDTSASLKPSAQYPEGVTFAGLRGLSDVVTADPRFGECVAKKLMTYGLGRVLNEADEPALTAMVERWREPGSVPSIRRLVRELVLSDAFRFRRAEGTR